MVARPYLRTPRSKIVQTAHLVQRKRHEFISAISKGLIPPDTSPSARKKRKIFTVEIDVSVIAFILKQICCLHESLAFLVIIFFNLHKVFQKEYVVAVKAVKIFECMQANFYI